MKYRGFTDMDAGSVIGDKIASAISGLAGGGSMMHYIRPATIGEAFARGGTSTGCAIIFSGPALHALQMPNGWEFQLVSGFVIGFVSYSVLGALARFLHKHRASDIVTMVKAARGDLEEKEPEPKPRRVRIRKKSPNRTKRED